LEAGYKGQGSGVYIEREYLKRYKPKSIKKKEYIIKNKIKQTNKQKQTKRVCLDRPPIKQPIADRVVC